MKTTIKTVTSDGWNVSAETNSYSTGAILHTFKMQGNKIRKGEGYGRRFETSAAAFAWALEHGHLEPFRTPWCRHCRQAHTFLGRRSGFCDVLGVFTSAPGRYNVRTGAVDLPNANPIGGVR